MYKSMNSEGQDNKSRKTLAREARRVRAASKKARKRVLVGILGGSVGLALIAGLFVPQLGQMGLNRTVDEGQADQIDIIAGTEIPIQESEEYDRGESLPSYNLLPPTSGPKDSELAPWGVSNTQLDDALVVSNLERGGVVFNHNLANENDILQLTDYVKSLPGFPACIIQTPHSAVQLGSITMTAWGWTQTFNSIEPEGMKTFFDAHINRAPLYFDEKCGLEE